MIRPANEGIEVWLCVEPVDFRKQITGLATLVQDRAFITETLECFPNRTDERQPDLWSDTDPPF